MSDLLQIKPYVRMLRERAEEHPNAVAITCGTESVTRGELESRSNRLARSYASLGLKFGDLATIGLPNSVEFYAATIAIWKCGAVPQPVSYRLPAIERRAIVELANSKLVLGAASHEHPNRICLAAGFEPNRSIDDGPLEEVVSPVAKAPTSGGSTGRPKLILAGGPAAGPAGAGVLFGMAEGDVQLVPGPLYHNAPFTLSVAGLFLGHHLIVLPKFDEIAALEAIDRLRVTWVNLVPTMMSRMLRVITKQPDRFDLSSLRQVWHMAAPCAPWLKQAWIDLVGPEKVMELYGGTEGQSVTIISGNEWLEHLGSVGKPIMGEMIILDEQGNPAPAGQVGEIFMRRAQGAPVTYRYVGAVSREVNGWETLGDFGSMDKDGYVYISDRRTDMILSGGANVYPAEVEAAIDSHPRVLASVVVGLPDDDLVQRVHALVQPDGELSEKEILEYLADRLVRYKVPRSVEFIDAPPRDDAGKVRRSAVRDAAVVRAKQRSDP